LQKGEVNYGKLWDSSGTAVGLRGISLFLSIHSRYSIVILRLFLPCFLNNQNNNCDQLVYNASSNYFNFRVFYYPQSTGEHQK